MKQKNILNMFIFMTLFSTTIFAKSLNNSDISNMVEKIKKERSGISLGTLESTENPFIIKIPKKKESPEVKEELSILGEIEVVYNLKAILNKAAFIDKKWYKHGDTIGNYKVGYISSTSVVLKSENGSKTLSLEKKKKNFIKSYRGYK